MSLRQWWFYARGSMRWITGRGLTRPFAATPWMKCARCKRRRWAEDVIAGEGWCARCWDVAGPWAGGGV